MSNYQAVPCPRCSGKGEVTWMEEDEDGYGNMETYRMRKECPVCKGKHFVKICIDDLEEI